MDQREYNAIAKVADEDHVPHAVNPAPLAAMLAPDPDQNHPFVKMGCSSGLSHPWKSHRRPDVQMYCTPSFLKAEQKRKTKCNRNNSWICEDLLQLIFSNNLVFSHINSIDYRCEDRKKAGELRDIGSI
jgi:hypothetical protein